ncbi:MAG: N-acetyl-gamma-glutamyl-phosphate reductase, partial [Paraburkholderia sp.]|nr:N-acetyl-gamma-glutamyl-phosphate reductase [Paraburkholderia sp.]
DNLRLSVFVNAERGQVLLSAVFDNLGKGASGAAVQNLDLMLAGFESPLKRGATGNETRLSV